MDDSYLVLVLNQMLHACITKALSCWPCVPNLQEGIACGQTLTSSSKVKSVRGQARV